MRETLLTAEQVAERLAVPESWVREHTRAGSIPHLRLGRYVRYRWPEVVEWLEELRSGGGPTFRRHHPRAPTTP